MVKSFELLLMSVIFYIVVIVFYVLELFPFNMSNFITYTLIFLGGIALSLIIKKVERARNTWYK